MFGAGCWVSRWPAPVLGGWGTGGCVRGSCNTYSVRHVPGSHYLLPGGYFNVHFTEEELRLGEGLVFCVLLCTTSGCLLMALCPPRGSPLKAPSLPTNQRLPKSCLFYVTNASGGASCPPTSPGSGCHPPHTPPHIRCAPSNLGPGCRMYVLIPKPDHIPV